MILENVLKLATKRLCEKDAEMDDTRPHSIQISIFKNILCPI
jgi:hypothetical protein